MATQRLPGPLTAETDSYNPCGDGVGTTVAHPGPIGLSDESTELHSGKTVVRVTKDWTDPPAVDFTYEPEITASTLKAVLIELKKLPSWGKGGGSVKGTGENGDVQANSPDRKRYTIALVGKFITQLPKWMNYGDATTAQKQSWDNMMAELMKHEAEHVRIAHKFANKLVRDLTGIDVMKAAQTVADSQTATKTAQDDFDSPKKTDHGQKAWGKFKKVFLDTSVDP
jgi:hypothetical protein